MPTDEIIIRLFCMVDDQLGPVNKRLDAHLCPSEIVTIGLLFALKGGHFRAFESWLNKNYRAWFPHLPERTWLQRLLRDVPNRHLTFWPTRAFVRRTLQHKISSAVRGAPGTSVLPSKPI